jgi:hypothetical protein
MMPRASPSTGIAPSASTALHIGLLGAVGRRKITGAAGEPGLPLRLMVACETAGRPRAPQFHRSRVKAAAVRPAVEARG